MTQVKAISIPKPCHQDWQQMTPNTDGRHCQHCRKTVTDFTQMDNAAIIQYLSAQQHTCGRFDEHQFNMLNHHLYTKNLQPVSWWKKVAIGLGLLSQLSAGKVEAQVKTVPMYQMADTSSKAHIPFILGKVIVPQQQKLLTGDIVDENNIALTGAIIRLPDSHLVTYADKQGKFSIQIPANATRFEVGFIGYVTQNLPIDLNTDHEYHVKFTAAQQTLMGDITIVKISFVKRMYYRLIRRPIRKLFN